MGVIGLHLAVPVQVPVLEILDGGALPGDVVQQGLGVVPIRFTVAIEVTSSQLLLREDGLAPGSPGHIGVQGRCGQVHVLGQLGFILIAVGIAHKVILSEHIGRQGEGLCPVFQIVNLEGKLVLAPPLWVLAQLCLDFAVGLAVHQDVCICTGGSGGIHQTGALLNHREEIAIFVPHRNGGGHHEALGQGPVRNALLGQAPLPDGLLHQGGDTGNLGRCHGGAAHELILIGLAHCAVDGVDVAARGRDFRLQAQIARHTPGAKVAHNWVPTQLNRMHSAINPHPV